MSKRLQIVVSDEEAGGFQRTASKAGLTLSEWSRRALRRAQQRQAGAAPEQKLQALERALACGHPTAAIDQMLSEIERGRDLR